jgi:catechol 2,3-dioxygenase-like lactoylglutathione lyase family enzyme
LFDHVTIRVSDLEESQRLYATALALLGFGEPKTDGQFYEWNDLSISQARDDRPVTKNLHLGLVARTHELVDEFWRVLTEAGFRDDGRPGPREQYRPGYYGAFVLDPEGNSVEAVYKDNLRKDGGCIDHLWLRVQDVDASVGFYETIAPVLGFRLQLREHGWVHFRGLVGSFTLTSPQSEWSVARPLTENVHMAFAAQDKATVDEFHRLALATGYRDNGGPGERPEYHPGYYGAYVLDPDGNNVEAVFHDRKEGR